MSNGEEEARRKIIIDNGLIQMAAECSTMAARGELSREQLDAMVELDQDWMQRTKRVMGRE